MFFLSLLKCGFWAIAHILSLFYKSGFMLNWNSYHKDSILRTNLIHMFMAQINSWNLRRLEWRQKWFLSLIYFISVKQLRKHCWRNSLPIEEIWEVELKKKKMALVKAGHDWKLRIDHENKRANYNYRVTCKWSQKSLCTSYQAQGFVDLSHWGTGNYFFFF